MTAYLFDTDAISETLKKQPSRVYINWLKTIARGQQFVSSVSVGELYKGAYRSKAIEQHLINISEHILPRLTVLPYDVNTAIVFGQISAELEQQGKRLADADLQIAATVIAYNLELVTGNAKHFRRIKALKLNPIFIDNR